MATKTGNFWMGLILSLLALPSLSAQTTNAGPVMPALHAAPAFPDGIWELSHENDWFIYSDRDFTAGLRLAYTTPNYPDWAAVPLVPAASGNFFNRLSLLDDRQAVVAGGIYAQQNLYTPNKSNLNPPDPTDRPYAGWVGLGLDLIRQTADRRAILETNLGWVGPASGAGDLQNGFHALVGDSQFQGWDDQIKNEPVLQLTYRQDWRLAAWSNLSAAAPGPYNYDFITHALATGGNGWDYAAVGFLARWGYHLPLDFGPARMRLGDIDSAPYAAPGALKSSVGDGSFDPFSAYVCFGAEGRAVARDITLDGNTLARSAGVVRCPVVGEIYAGVVTQYKNFRGSFLVIYESDTFESQPQPGQWRGVVTLGWQF